MIGNFSDYVGDGVIAANLGSGLGALDVSAAYSFTCALTTENKVKCFGLNYHAQLGLGENIDRGRSPYDMGENLTYIDFGTNVEVKSIHSGPESMHTCVILSKPTNSAQKVKCWGLNGNGQLGYGDKFSRGDNLSEMGDNLPLIDLGTESRAKQLQFGYISTCVLLVNDKLKCFGSNEYGELGYGSTGDVVLTGDALPFVQIDVGKSVKSISNGSQHNCVLYSDDVTVKCIGYNSEGQLGQGDKLPRGDGPETTYPNITAIDFGIGTAKISAVYSGINSNCIVLENYLVKCWGNGDDDALLVGSNENLGDQPYEMGTNLSYAQLFAPTQSPTQSPTLKPTLAPTLPTQSPTIRPTSKPTENTKSEGFANQRSFFALHFYVVVAFLLLLVA